MARATDIKVSLDKDVHELFHATRMIHCLASSCKNHSRFEATCRLKKIYIRADGACEQYEPREPESGP